VEESRELQDPVEVRVFKYDANEHRRWPAFLVRRDGPLLVLDAVFNEDIEHELLGKIASGTISIEYYWLHRWYNVFRFSDRDAKFQNFYCNVSMPPSFDGHVLSYVDLDIDVLVKPDFSYQVLDLEDFEDNARALNYPLEVRENAHAALAELIGLIEARSFPFDE
jgi:protein associated with RNAse G/E